MKRTLTFSFAASLAVSLVLAPAVGAGLQLGAEAIAQPAERPPDAPVAKPRPKPKAKAKPKAKPTAASSTTPVDPYADPVPGDPYADDSRRPVRPAIPARIGIADLPAVQGLLAVQRLDGWLLHNRDGENRLAAQLVQPTGQPTRPWFYLLPARGAPVALVHSSEQASFAHLAGTKLTYQGYRDLDTQLRAMLKGVRTVAVELAARTAVPGKPGVVAGLDAGTIAQIRATGVQVRASDTMVQFTRAIWGDAGRTAHHVAVHHLVELRKDALAFVTKAIQTGQPITEYDVQQRVMRGMTMRGLISTPPAIAAGINTVDPYYVPDATRAAPIRRGDLLVIGLAAKVDKPDGVWAAQTWVAVVDATVPAPLAKAFETVSLARDHALSLITDRVRKGRAIRGAEVDDAVRGFLKKAGVADRVLHRTGHSLDNDLQGSGANLDNFEVKDTRILTPGTGFTVGPGLYFPGAHGVRAEVSVYLAPSGPELTTPAQDEIDALLAR